MNKVSSSHSDCLQKICRILWPRKTTNKELYIKTGYRRVISEFKHCHLCLSRSHQEKGNEADQRWPGEEQWRLLKMRLSCGEAQLAAKDHDRWRNIIDRLCAKGGEEHKFWRANDIFCSLIWRTCWFHQQIASLLSTIFIIAVWHQIQNASSHYVSDVLASWLFLHLPVFSILH